MIKILLKTMYASLFFCFLLVCSRTALSALEVLFEYTERTEIARGVFYERNRQMTTLGMRDVHILSVPLNDPFINLSAAESARELGLKEPAADLLRSANAIAGVNGDFFGLAGTHSLSFGPIASNGRLHSVTRAINADSNEFAALFIDSSNNPFIGFFRAEIRFLNNGRENIRVGAVNKVTDMVNPIVITAEAMSDTAQLDRRFPDMLVKIVVDKGSITYVSKKGETVAIPPDGYIVVLGEYADERARLFAAGQKAELRVTNNLNIDFNNVQMSIGGGGIILRDGSVVYGEGTVVSGRHPRTAAGYTANGRRLILMVVDGRTHSIGATHDELASLLVRYGAHNAMHLDGGGSSTMIVGNSVVNTVSDGAQRRIINALGIIDTSPTGEIRRINMEVSSAMLTLGALLEVEVFGSDSYLHKIGIPSDEIVYTIGNRSGETREFTGGSFQIDRTDYAYVSASYKNFNANHLISVVEISELRSHMQNIQVREGETVPLSFTGIGPSGEEIFIPGASAGLVTNVVPASLGTVRNGVFYAAAGRTGTGYLRCGLNGIYTFVPVTVGVNNLEWPLFARMTPIFYMQYPARPTGGSVRYTSDLPENAGRVARLDYSFDVSDEPQDSGLLMVGSLQASIDASAVRLRVYGDGCGLWLRGRVTDSTGKIFRIDFTFAVDFEGWQICEAELPNDLKPPFRLDYIYLHMEENNQPLKGTVFFSRPELLSLPKNERKLPESHVFTDRMRENLSGAKNEYYDADLNIAGLEYDAYSFNRAGIIKMTAVNGGIFSADMRQWSKFSRDLAMYSQRFVIVQLDANPESFSQAKERELLHSALVAQRDTGKTVFVVAPNTVGNRLHECVITDGIRYINAPAGSTVRFRVEGNRISYDIINE